MLKATVWSMRHEVRQPRTMARACPRGWFSNERATTRYIGHSSQTFSDFRSEQHEPNEKTGAPTGPDDRLVF